MMLHPARRDGATGGTSIGTLLHVAVVPGAISPLPWHDVTKMDRHVEPMSRELRNPTYIPRYSVYCISTTHVQIMHAVIGFTNVNLTDCGTLLIGQS